MKKYIIPGILILVLLLPKISVSATIYSNDFESGDGGLLKAGSVPNMWEWGFLDWNGWQAHSGQNCWGTKLNETYQDSYATNYLIITNVDLTGSPYAHMSFWHWYDMDRGDDGGNISISTDGGANYILITNGINYNYTYLNSLGEPGWSGNSDPNWMTEWTFEEIDISDFAKKNVNIRFRFSTDWEMGWPGWYLDDIVVKNTPQPAAGTGRIRYAPVLATPSSTNVYYFMYTAEKNIYNGEVTFDIPAPAGWSWPDNTTPGNQGYVKVFPNNGSPRISTTPGVAGNIVTVYLTNMSQNESFVLVYSNAVTPPSFGDYEFTVKSKQTNEILKDIKIQPDVGITEIRPLPYSDNFESDRGIYSTAGSVYNIWERGDPTYTRMGAPYSGDYCWGTDIDDSYPTNAREYFYLPILDLTGNNYASLSFFHAYDFSQDYQAQSGGNISISTNFGWTWDLLGDYPWEYNEEYITALSNAGFRLYYNNEDWAKAEFDLSPYTGKYVLIRFNMISDNYEVGTYGWYIDDIFVKTNAVQVAGSGKMQISPPLAPPGTTNTHKFIFTAEKAIYNGKIAITFPAAWPTPQTNNSLNPGYITLNSTDAIISTIPMISNNIVIITATNIDTGCGFNLTYSNAYAPSSFGDSIFIVRTKGQNDLNLQNISPFPAIAVLDIITNFPFTDDFETNKGIYAEGGSSHYLWEWGTPSSTFYQGPSSTHGRRMK